MFKMTESVIYEGEVKDMLLKLCQKEYDIRKNDPEMRDWRRTYLLKDIIDNNELFSLNIYCIILTLEVSHFEISGNDINDSQP